MTAFLRATAPHFANHFTTPCLTAALGDGVLLGKDAYEACEYRCEQEL